uniref:Reverse transcriptase Ty1/copia-type domain-containing protein n=1 Tax=Tanacetum cinerariifolium TaxID=118510 RepID=A0A6L2LKY7_TANCI|nr:hypothetical protein [Tanacetum cinerariifolium]
MADLEYCAKHNMVAYIEKTYGNTEFHEMVDFLTRSSIHYTLTVSLDVCTSFIEQFWNSATSKTFNNVSQIKAKVAGQRVVILKASIRRDLLFNDVDWIDCLSTHAIFENLALMRYEGDLTKLTFQKALFSPQWKFLIHIIIHCLSSKSTSWDQFPTLIISAVICLATYKSFNFSKIIFDGRVTPLFLSMLAQAAVEEGEGGQTSRGDEGELTLHDLLVTCTKLSKHVLRGGKKAKTGLNIEEGDFNKLDDLVDEGADYAVNKGRSTDKIEVLNAEAEGVSAAGETLSAATLAVSTASVQEANISLAGIISTARIVSTAGPSNTDVAGPSNQEDVQDLFDDETRIADILVNITNARPRPVMITDPGQEQRRATPMVQPAIDPKDKGKGKMVEPKPTKELKKRDFDATQIARDERFLYDEVQAKMDASEELAARLQIEEREMYTVEERSRFTHSQLNKRSFEDIQALYLKEHALIANFVPIGSEEDEKKIREINKKAKGESSDKGVDSTKKRKSGSRMKRMSKRQKTAADLEEEGQLEVFLNIIPDEEGEVNYAVLDKRVFRAGGSSRYIKTFTKMVLKFDRLDFIELHSLVMQRFETTTPEGIDLILWCDLRIMFEEKDGTEFYMLAERRYPLTKETLERMLALRLIVESASLSRLDPEAVTRDLTSSFVSHDVITIKYGSLSRYKACLMAIERSQQYGVDCDDTFSPVVKPVTICTVLNLTLSRNLPIHQLDVKNAFLNNNLFEIMYISLVAYTDADWAGCLTTMWFTSGYYVFLGDNLLLWSAKQQHTLSRSSAEAEYKGVANVVAKISWLHNHIIELHTPLLSATLVYYDNVSAIYMTANPVQHQQTKHIKIDIHFIRDMIARGQVCVLHVLSDYQFADIFTKGLPSAFFEKFHNEDVDATANENADEDATKAKADEIAIRRAKLLAELEAINKEAKEPEKQKKTKIRDTKKDDNDSVDAAAKAKKDEEAATKRSNFIVRLKTRSKKLSKAEKQKHVEETKDDDVNEKETKSKEDAEENDDVVQVFKNIQTMLFLNTSKRSKTKQADKDREDSEDLNKELEEENNEDEIREATERKRTRKTEEEENMESNEQDGGSNSENEMLPEAKKRSKGSVKETIQKVHDILGIPMRNTKLQDLEQRDANDPFIAEWEAQYSHLKKPTPPAIAFQISSTTEEDFMFKMNFITLFGSTMGTLENGGRVPRKLLKCIKEEDDIAEIDWCGYILDCLRNGKVNWKDVKNKNNFYYGSLTFLCLLYLDSTFFPDLNIIRHRPAIRSWNTMMIRKRIKMETRQKCLGSLDLHGDFNPEEEQIEERSELVRTLKDGVTKFENDQMMIEFCKQYGELFNDNEFNVSESSMDDYRDGDSNADDNNKKNDDEKETMADGNKKSENENEKKESKDENGTGTKEEDEVSMDIDIPNKEMKQKEADKEKASDKNGDESEKEKQYEADKVEKKTSIKEKTTSDEVTMTEYLFSMKGEELDFVFETKDGAAAIRDYMQTLAPELKVESNVIDTFSLILNHEQKMNSNRNKIKYFFHTTMIVNKKHVQVEEGELRAFFPIIFHEHYYLVVFNFLKGNTVIIDNSKTKMTYDVKYKTVCELLTAKNWNLEFPTEEEGNTLDIIRMRVRLATKILSHELNIHREKISTEAQEFASRNTDKNLRKK